VLDPDRPDGPSDGLGGLLRFPAPAPAGPAG
jgi:hypothetical protein